MMKKHIKFYLIAVMGTMLWGCSPNSADESRSPQIEYENEITTESEIQIVGDSSKTETEEQSVSLENIPYQLQIEKLSGGNGSKSDQLFIIDDSLKLKQCIEYLDFEENKKLLEKYNEKWFETNVLLASTFGMSSDFRLEMNQVMVEDDCLRMKVEYIHTGWEKLSEAERERREEAKDYPTFHTDYCEWVCFIEIEKQYSEWIKAVSSVVAECASAPSYWEGVTEMKLEIADLKRVSDDDKYEGNAKPESEDIPDVLTGLLTHYIPGSDRSTKADAPQVIRSLEEFKLYCEREEKFVSEDEFQAIAERFDQEFWGKYDLLMTNWVEGNTGARSYIVSLTKGKESSEADWVITRRTEQSRAGNAVLAPWQAVTEVPKGVLKEDETFSFKYFGLASDLLQDRKALRTDMWKPADGGELWDMSETPLYLMDTRDQLEAYCKAHPELQGEFLEVCAGYDDDFWEERDLLLMVWREEDGAVIPRVDGFSRYRHWDPDKWFVELERKIPQTPADDPAIWHFFIEVRDGMIEAEDVIEILEKKVLEIN